MKKANIQDVGSKTDGRMAPVRTQDDQSVLSIASVSAVDIIIDDK